MMRTWSYGVIVWCAALVSGCGGGERAPAPYELDPACPSGASYQDGSCVPPERACRADEDCAAGLRCSPDGSCERRCASDADCEAERYCDAGARLCAPGCRDASSCEAGLICGDNRRCACSETSCEQGLTCYLGACVDSPPTSCDQVSCPPSSFCNPQDSFRCEFGCTDQLDRYNSCPQGYQCDVSTQRCKSILCAVNEPSDCVGTDRPLWSEDGCFCAECLADSDCEAGESCDTNGACRVCEPCGGAAGACGDAAPRCVAGCCLECLANLDCAAEERCVEGRCEPLPM